MMLLPGVHPPEGGPRRPWRGAGPWLGERRPGRNVKGTGRSWLGLRREHKCAVPGGSGKRRAEGGVKGPSQIRWEVRGGGNEWKRLWIKGPAGEMWEAIQGQPRRRGPGTGPDGARLGARWAHSQAAWAP